MDLLLTVFNSQAFFSPHATFDKIYITAATSPLHHHAFLDKLSKFIRAFTTPGQVPRVAQTTIESLNGLAADFEEASKVVSNEDDSTPRKKRKTEHGSQTTLRTPEPSAIAFAMTAGIASVVFTSLPLHLLQVDDFESVTGTIREYFDASQSLLKRVMKRIAGSGPTAWIYQIVASGLLRLRYALNSEKRLQLGAEGNQKVLERLDTLLNTEDLLPQLRVEIVSRSYTHYCSSTSGS